MNNFVFSRRGDDTKTASSLHKTTMTWENIKNTLSIPFAYLARWSFYFLSITFFGGSALCLITRSSETENFVFSEYSLMAIAVGSFSVTLLFWHKEAYIYWMQRKSPIISPVAGKFCSYIGPALGVFLGWLYSEKWVTALNEYVFGAYFLCNLGIFALQMLLVPMVSDFGLLDSLSGWLMYLVYRDFSGDWRGIVAVVICIMTLATKASYEGFLLKTAKEASVVLESRLEEEKLEREKEKLEREEEKLEREKVVKAQVEDLEAKLQESKNDVTTWEERAKEFEATLDAAVKDVITWQEKAKIFEAKLKEADVVVSYLARKHGTSRDELKEAKKNSEAAQVELEKAKEKSEAAQAELKKNHEAAQAELIKNYEDAQAKLKKENEDAQAELVEAIERIRQLEDGRAKGRRWYQDRGGRGGGT